MDLLFSDNQHELYSLNSVLIMTVSSLILFSLSLSNNIILKWICLISVLFFTHRFVITYIYPSTLDYHKLLQFSKVEIEKALLIYLYSLYALVLAFIVSKIKLIKNYSLSNKFLNSEYKLNNSIKILGVPANFNSQVKWLLYAAVILSLIKIFFFFNYNFGIIGNTISEDLTYLMRVVTLSDIMFFPIIFIYIYVKKESLPNKKLIIFALLLVIFTSAMMTSRAIILVFILNAYLTCMILNIRIPRKYFILSILGLLFAVFFFYTFMTSLREAIIVEDMSKLKIISKDYVNLIIGISSRVGTAYDSWFLWSSQLPSLSLRLETFSITNDFFRLINSFYIGELVEVPSERWLGKYQLEIGRGYLEFDKHGGTSENPGPISTAWIYFHQYSFIYWFMLYYFLLKLQDFNLHPFWVFFIVYSYAHGPSGNIVMQSTAFTFLMIFFLIGILVITLRVIKRYLIYS